MTGVLGCAVCVAGLEAALPWYFATAVVLSVLPFAFVGGLGFWLYRRARAASARPDSSADD